MKTVAYCGARGIAKIVARDENLASHEPRENDCIDALMLMEKQPMSKGMSTHTGVCERVLRRIPALGQQS